MFANLEMLKRTAAEGPPQRQLGRVEEASRRFEGTSRAILALIRRPAGDIAPVRLSEAIGAIQPLLQMILSGPGALSVSLVAVDPPVLLERSALEEALLTLRRPDRRDPAARPGAVAERGAGGGGGPADPVAAGRPRPAGAGGRGHRLPHRRRQRDASGGANGRTRGRTSRRVGARCSACRGTSRAERRRQRGTGPRIGQAPPVSLAAGARLPVCQAFRFACLPARQPFSLPAFQSARSSGSGGLLRHPPRSLLSPKAPGRGAIDKGLRRGGSSKGPRRGREGARRMPHCLTRPCWRSICWSNRGWPPKAATTGDGLDAALGLLRAFLVVAMVWPRPPAWPSGLGPGAAGAGLGRQTFDAVKSRGQLVCGVTTGLAGFAQPDSQGVWRGIDADTAGRSPPPSSATPTRCASCRPRRRCRFTALQSGEMDVLSRNTTWTLSRDATLGLDFAATNFYDGQGFMVKTSLGVKSAKELDGATICVQPGTTTEQNLTRLVARQQHQVHAGGDRAAGGDRQRLSRRPLRRLSPPTSPAWPRPARPSRGRTTT